MQAEHKRNTHIHFGRCHILLFDMKIENQKRFHESGERHTAGLLNECMCVCVCVCVCVSEFVCVCHSNCECSLLKGCFSPTIYGKLP